MRKKRTDIRTDRVGESHIDKNGRHFTIVKYRGFHDFDIQYLDDGVIKKITNYADIRRNRIVHPDDTKYQNNLDYGHRVKHPLYSMWKRMYDKCNNPNNPYYKHYGEKGITICTEWDNVLTFNQHLGEIWGFHLLLNKEHVSVFLIPGKTEYNQYNCLLLPTNLARKLLTYITKGWNIFKTQKKDYYRSYIYDGGKQISLGYHKTPKEARNAYIVGVNKYIIEPAIKKGFLPLGFVIDETKI